MDETLRRNHEVRIMGKNSDRYLRLSSAAGPSGLIYLKILATNDLE